MVFGRKVSPAAPEPSPFLVVVGVVDRVLRGAWRYWNSVQVGHRGRYSIERLLSFRDYYARTSPTRVFVVCMLGLLPAFVVAILVEFIPLRPPTESWKANYMFWVRLYVSSLPIAFGGVYQVKEVIQPGIISTTGIIATAVGSCTCYVAVTIAVAALWKFPIQFGYVLTIGPFVAFYMIFFMLSIGLRKLGKSPILRQQIFSQMLVIAAQGMLAIAYPTFGAIFKQLSGHQQTAFIFVLPIIKFSIKKFIAKTSANMHEYVGRTVVLSVDVCNVLYVAICLQTAISPVTTTLMVAMDAFFVLLALHSIYKQSNVAQARMASSLGAQRKTNYMQDLMALTLHTFQLARILNATPAPIRIRAPFPLPLSEESTTLMNKFIYASHKNDEAEVDAGRHLDANTISTIAVGDTRSPHIQTNSEVDSALKLSYKVSNDRRIAPAPQSITRSPTILIRLSKVFMPQNTVNSLTSNAPSASAIPLRHHAAVNDVQDALQALFHSECVVMAEFIECVTPVLYAVYLAFLYHLPTAAYYPHTRSLTPEKFATIEANLVLYALIELTLFVALNILLKRKFGFAPLYQLAFVFETHSRTLQSHLFVWVLCSLQITLIHNCVDLEAPFK